MKKTQIACKSGYKYEALENWVSAQRDDYFLEEIYLYFSLSTKKVCQCLVTEKKPLYPYLFFLLHIYFFLSFFHLWIWHAHPTPHRYNFKAMVMAINDKALISQLPCWNKVWAAAHVPIKSHFTYSGRWKYDRGSFLCQLCNFCPRKLNRGAVLLQMLINSWVHLERAIAWKQRNLWELVFPWIFFSPGPALNTYWVHQNATSGVNKRKKLLRCWKRACVTVYLLCIKDGDTNRGALCSCQGALWPVTETRAVLN